MNRAVLARLLVGGLSVSFWLGLAGSAPPNTTAASQLTLSLKPHGVKASEIEILMEGTGTSGSTEVYLRAASRKTGVRLFAEPVTADGIEVPDAAIGFSINGQPQDAIGFTLPRNARPVVVKVTASGITKDGSFTTRIRASIGNDLVLLTTLKITRSSVPKLEIDGAIEGAVTRKSDTLLYDQILVVKAKTAAQVDEATLSVTLYDGIGHQLTPKVSIDGAKPTGASVDLGTVDPSQPKLVRLKVDLPETGPYTGVLTLAYDDRQEDTKLSIERTHNAPTIEARDVATVRSEFIPMWQFWSELSANPTVEVLIHETAGTNVALDKAEVSLVLVHGDTRDQAAYKSVCVERVPPLEGDAKKDGGPALSLAPDEEVKLNIVFTGLDQPGHFEGLLVMTRAGSGRVEVPFKIDQRVAWWLALGVIAIGVIASWGFRQRLGTSSSKLRRQRDVYLVQQRLRRVQDEFDINSEERLLLTRLVQQLKDIGEKITKNRQDNVDAELTDLAGRVDLVRPWVVYRIRIEALQPRSLVDGLRDPLRRIGDELAVPNHLQETKTALGDLPGKIESGMRANVVAEARDTKSAIANMTHLGDADVNANLTERLEAIISDTTSSAAELKTRLEEIRASYVRNLISSMLPKLSAAEPPPAWIGPDKWRDARLQAADALRAASNQSDTGAALVAYRAAHLRYVQALAIALRDHARNVVNTDQSAASVYQPIADTSAAAIRAVSEDQLAAGQRKLTDAIAAFDAAQPAPQVQPAAMPRGRMGGSRPAGADERDLLATDLGMGNPLASGIALQMASTRFERPPVPDPQPLLNNIDRELRRRELFVAIGTIIFATATGFFALYVDRPTWGAWEDIGIALLWGVGLHQVAGKALDLDNVRKILIGEAPPPTPSAG